MGVTYSAKQLLETAAGKRHFEEKQQKQEARAYAPQARSTPPFIFISGNVPSSKNGKICKGGKAIKNPAVMEYESAVGKQFIANKLNWEEMIHGMGWPLTVYYKLIRSTKHFFDYHNIIQVIADLMTEDKGYGWIPDDDADHVIFIPARYAVDKHNPGIYLWV